MIIFIAVLALTNIILIISFLIYYLKTRNSVKDVLVLQQQLHLVNTKLKQIDQDKRDFIDVITHEVNTPLAMIIGYISMILEYPETEINPTVLNLSKKSLNASQRMSKIISDLLATSQTIGEGRAQSFQIDEIIDKLIQEFSDFAKERGLDLSYKIPKSLPLPLVVADPLNTKIIISNLINNALKYTKKGSVVVETEVGKNEMIIKVSDTGIGIDKDELNKIFEKFYQVDNSHTREVGGTGVGLYIVKTFVERQGGRVWVESQPEKGSIFYFTLPLA